MSTPQNPYQKMLTRLAQQVSLGQAMLRKMGLFQAFASLRDYHNPLGNVIPKEVQKKAQTTAEANGLSISFWLAKAAESTVDPRTVVKDTANLVEEVINLAPQPRAYACRRGCNFCCYEAVTVSEIEAAALARHINALADAERSAILSRLESYANAVRAVGADLMYRNRVPCAFLDTESGACTVYTIRPYMCRALTSYDVAPCQTGSQSYQVDHIRYGAYTATFVGSAHSDLPDHLTVMKLPRDQQAEGENLAIGVLRQLSLSREGDNQS